MPFAIGQLVEAVTAGGSTARMRVAGPQRPGRWGRTTFPVIDLATEQDWARGKSLGERPDVVPWPVESITSLSGRPAAS